MGEPEAANFLSFLALDRNVAVAIQDQTLNALNFFVSLRTQKAVGRFTWRLSRKTSQVSACRIKSRGGSTNTNLPKKCAQPSRIAVDLAHSIEQERRFYCFGKTDNGILTVKLTWCDRIIRIIGAGYWRRGKRIYEQENQI